MRNEIIRISVRSLYDMQKLRIQQGNRIAASFRTKLGLASSEAEEANQDAEKLLKQLRDEYRRITDGVARITKTFKSDSTIITSMSELRLLESYERQLEAEAIHEKAIMAELENERIWTEYLKDVRGVGPLMAGVILSEYDINKAAMVSQMWSYAGLDVVLSEDENGNIIGEARSKKKHHLVKKTYTNRDGEIVETVGISFNPFLRTKLLGVLAPVFLKLGGKYKTIYDGHKNRLQNTPRHADKPKLHIHNMAMRYMIKIFVQDLYVAWRTIEGLPVRAPYAEEKLGIVHSK